MGSSQQGSLHTYTRCMRATPVSAAVSSRQPPAASGWRAVPLAVAPRSPPRSAPRGFCSRSQQGLNEVEWGSDYGFNEDENPDSHLVLSSQL